MLRLVQGGRDERMKYCYGYHEHQQRFAHRPGWPRSLSFLSHRSAASFSILPRMAPSCGRENTVTSTWTHDTMPVVAHMFPYEPVQGIAPTGAATASRAQPQ